MSWVAQVSKALCAMRSYALSAEGRFYPPTKSDPRLAGTGFPNILAQSLDPKAVGLPAGFVEVDDSDSRVFSCFLDLRIQLFEQAKKRRRVGDSHGRAWMDLRESFAALPDLNFLPPRPFPRCSTLSSSAAEYFDGSLSAKLPWINWPTCA